MRTVIVSCDRCGEAIKANVGIAKVDGHGAAKTYDLCLPCVDAVTEFLYAIKADGDIQNGGP